VRDTEARARAAQAKSAERGASGKPAVVSAVTERADAERARLDAEDALSAALGLDANVRIKRRGCSVEILFENLDEVHELAQRIAHRLAA
jgi:hypothetical protein